MTRPAHPTRSLATRMRMHSVRMVHAAQASHIGSALSASDIIAVLFGSVMRLNPQHARWDERDRFILSKGHACVALYSVLAELGYFDPAALQTYGADFSDFMTHVSHKVPGVEFSTGSLGHGLPFGAGKALAAKKRGQSWRTFVLLGDGEVAEGSNWEAALFAAHHRLDNLVAIIDCNALQSLTTVAETLAIEPLAKKFEAFGWSARELDGHDHEALQSALAGPPWEPGKPSVLIARTVKGKGVSYMEHSVAWHYRSPTQALLEQALEELAAHA